MPFFSRLTAFLLILLASDFHRQRISYESVGKAKAVCPDVFENNKISRRKFSIEAFFNYVIFKTGAAGDGKIIQHFLDATVADDFKTDAVTQSWNHHVLETYIQNHKAAFLDVKDLCHHVKSTARNCRSAFKNYSFFSRQNFRKASWIAPAIF